VHVSIGEWLLIAITVTIAAGVQGIVGFGSNLLAVPVVAVIVPGALPGAMVFPSVPVTLVMALHERRHIDWRGTRFLTLGRLPGTALGVVTVALVSSRVLAIVIGGVVIVAVLTSVLARHLHPGVTPATAVATGVVTGVTGTAAAIEGPPLALLYQNAPAPVFRATLATQFTIGTVVSLVGLLLGGALHGWQVLLGLSLMPAFGVGLALSLPLRRRLRAPTLRPAVLTLAAMTGLAAILRSVV
jgi:uncharacterized membrane protein YfcA